MTVRLYARGRTYTGRGLSTDVIEASINAYLSAVNTFCAAVRREEEQTP